MGWGLRGNRAGRDLSCLSPWEPNGVSAGKTLKSVGTPLSDPEVSLSHITLVLVHSNWSELYYVSVPTPGAFVPGKLLSAITFYILLSHLVFGVAICPVISTL